MLNKLKLKRAKKKDVKNVARLFSMISQKIDHKTLVGQIKDKKIYILKHKKRIAAAFSYSLIGIAGFFAVMYISKFAVDPEFQRQGLGAYLLSRIRKVGLKAGAGAILLYSIKTAKRFYEKNKLNKLWRFFWLKVKY